VPVVARLTANSGEAAMASIVGTWKLVRAAAHDAAGNELPSPYGPQAMGRVTFTADGRMMSVVCDGRRDLPAGAARDYSSYCGNYTFDGAQLVTRVDAASDPSRIGSDQVRGVRFDGAHMILLPPPRGTGAGAEHREITWERIAAE
jgi:Lipocalin-like domain